MSQIKNSKYNSLCSAVISDTEKSAIQAALNDNEALITSDWAQKVLPQSAMFVFFEKILLI